MANVTRLSFDQGDKLEHRRLHLREISPDLDAPLETVGEDLRTARQRKGEDLATVSGFLKIRKDHLTALEESTYDLLPGRAYAVGFVRSYAEYLGLEAPMFVERYKAEIAGLDETEEPQISLAPDVERKFPQGTMVLVALLLIGIAYGGYYLQSSANQMLTERETTIPERFKTAVDEQPQATIAPPPAQTASERATSVTAALAEAEPLEAAQNASLVPPSQVSAPASTVDLPAGEIYGTRNSGSRISLRIHESTNVRVIGADGTLFINRTLSPGDRYQTPNIMGMRISTANAGSIELILDDGSLGFLGSNGIEANALSLNPQDIVDRAQ